MAKELNLAPLALLYFAVFTANAVGSSSYPTRDYIESKSLLRAIEDSTLVVVGEVIDKVGIFRRIYPYHSQDIITTDVVVDVHDVLKGKPNRNETTVVFTIQGGDYVNPDTGRMAGMTVSGEAEFDIGEHVLLFLTNKPEPFYNGYPNNGYRLADHRYGKIGVENDSVRVLYYIGNFERDMQSRISLFGNKPARFDFRSVILPLDLVVQLGLAFKVDPEATRILEDTIKDIARPKRRYTRVVLDPVIVKALTSETERVIESDKIIETYK